MKHIIGYSSGFYWALLAVITGTGITGLLMIPSAMEFKFDTELSWQLESAQRLITAELHALAAIALTFLVGALWPIHMRAGLRKKRNINSGLFSASSLLILAISGWGLYYFGDLKAQQISSASHMVAGCLFLSALGFHILLAKKRYKKAYRSEFKLLSNS